MSLFPETKACFHFTIPGLSTEALWLILKLILRILTIRVYPDQKDEIARKDLGMIQTLFTFSKGGYACYLTKVTVLLRRVLIIRVFPFFESKSAY